MRSWVIVLALAAAALVGAFVGSSVAVAAQKRALQREVRSEAADERRFVDFGVRLVVVRMDLEHGEELLPDLPPLQVIRTYDFGGMVDTWGETPDFVGPSVDPVVWYCSEDAAPIIMHGDDLPSRLLVYGSEGAGKTRVLVQWLGLRVLEATGSGHRLGMTSPTNPRAAELKEAIEELWPAAWYSYADKKKTFTVRNGVRVQLQSTYKQSKKAGSRVQTFNWRAAASDEIQDSLDADADIEMRGRKAPGGRYKRLCTATSKDSSDFREWRDRSLSARGADDQPLWQKRTLLGQRSPFVWPKFWADKRGTMSAREWRRRIGAEDLPPENRVYYGFERERNLMPLPELARDVSAEVFSAFRPYTGRNRNVSFGLLAGHDPGEIRNVTTFLRPYLHRGALLWWVVGRFITERTTAEQHAQRLKKHVQHEYGLNYDATREDPSSSSGRLLVMCDPHGRGESTTDYHTVYGAFTAAGLDIFNAAGDESVIKASARRDMVNGLFDPDSGPARLYIARPVDGGDSPAPELVAALEQLELDHKGKAEKNRKTPTDPTHHPVSLGYALWPFEAPAVKGYTLTRVLKLLGRAA